MSLQKGDTLIQMSKPGSLTHQGSVSGVPQQLCDLGQGSLICEVGLVLVPFCGRQNNGPQRGTYPRT